MVLRVSGRRFAVPRLIAPLLVSAALLLPAVSVAAPVCVRDEVSPRSTDQLLDRLFARTAVRERISEWGRDLDEIRHDLNHLRPEERQKLACLLSNMHADPSVERDALFLVVVSIMREQRLFKNIVQYSRVKRSD